MLTLNDFNGHYLDVLGPYLGLHRKPGESDNQYRRRMLEVLRSCNMRHMDEDSIV